LFTRVAFAFDRDADSSFLFLATNASFAAKRFSRNPIEPIES